MAIWGTQIEMGNGAVPTKSRPMRQLSDWNLNTDSGCDLVSRNQNQDSGSLLASPPFVIVMLLILPRNTTCLLLQDKSMLSVAMWPMTDISKFHCKDHSQGGERKNRLSKLTFNCVGFFCKNSWSHRVKGLGHFLRIKLWPLLGSCVNRTNIITNRKEKRPYHTVISK